MKRKYGGQRRRTYKRRRITKYRGSRGIGSDSIYGRRVGTRKGSRRLRSFARKIKSINATPYPDNAFETFLSSSSATACRLLTYNIEGKPTASMTDGAKWHQNCRWTFSIGASADTVYVQKCEVYVVRLRKTMASISTGIDGPKTDMAVSLLSDSTNRSNFKIEKQYSFTLSPSEGKTITGFFKSPPRQTEDWRDATDVANYAPRGTLGLIVRYCMINSPTGFAAGISGQFHVSRHSYIQPYN